MIDKKRRIGLIKLSEDIVRGSIDQMYQIMEKLRLVPVRAESMFSEMEVETDRGQEDGKVRVKSVSVRKVDV